MAVTTLRQMRQMPHTEIDDFFLIQRHLAQICLPLSARRFTVFVLFKKTSSSKFEWRSSFQVKTALSTNFKVFGKYKHYL